MRLKPERYAGRTISFHRDYRGIVEAWTRTRKGYLTATGTNKEEAFEKIKMYLKKERVILHRNRSEENYNVGLWFENKNKTIIASVVRGAENKREKDHGVLMRITTPRGYKEIGFIGGLFSHVKKQEQVVSYARSVERYLQAFGYEAKVVV